MRRLGVVMGAMALMVAAGQAGLAQSRSVPAPRSALPRGDDDDKLPPSKPPPVDTLAPTRGISGPRLQPGAVLCRSEDDLRHRAEVARRQADGQPDAGNPLQNCTLIQSERGVEVVTRHGLGRTEVRLKPTGQAGWTDAYLP